MKKFFIVSVIALVCLTLMVSPTYSQQVKKPTKKLTTIHASQLQLKLQTDLRVDVIHASRCACDLPAINAFYMSNIMVDVSNHKVGSKGATTESILTVTYYDLMKGKMVTKTKDLAALKPYPTNPWTFQRYVVVNKPVLVRKLVGITAEIKPKANNVFDPVPANNKKKIEKCQVMVY